MQERGLLHYRLKFCCLKVICFIRQSNQLEREIKPKKQGGQAGAIQKSGAAMAHPRPPWNHHWV